MITMAQFNNSEIQVNLNNLLKFYEGEYGV